MAHPVSGIDHVFVLVEDLDASADRYARLGFTLSPRGLHSAAKGSANHTIVFDENYLELLGMIAETTENAPRRRMLERDGEGLRAIACRCEDAAGAAAALESLGHRTGAVSRFERPVPLADGGETRAAFTTLPFAADEVPTGLLFLCQHHTPEAVFRPELRVHANGARSLAAITILAADPQSTAARYASLLGTRAVEATASGIEVPTGSVPIVVLDRERIETRYGGLDLSGLADECLAGVRIRVDDPDVTRDVLDRADVRPIAVGSGLAVGPAHASGAIVEFVAG